MAKEITGQTLGHYRIVSRLGKGGMGDVYVAEDLKLKRRVALKVLPPDFAERAGRLERFQREAESIARLNHPNIVTVYSTEEVEGVRFMTMELVEGRSLEAAVPDGGLTVEKFLSLAHQIADALAAAHESGVIHRDLKPANIMVTDRGRVKVLDFGLAKVEEDPAAPLDTEASTMAATRSGLIVGTVPYMSPEQLEARPVDGRSDIFSLGLVMFEMLTGRPAFLGSSNVERAAAILHDSPSKVAELRDDLPRQLRRILASCLEKDTEKRMQSAKDLRNQLTSLKSELETGQLAAVVGDPAEPAVRVADAPSRPRGSRLALAVVAVLAIALVAGWLLLRRGAGPAGRSVAPALDSMAVLYFRNLTGQAELDWLSSGLTEMLVTDLSQVPELRLLGTEKLHSLLADLDALEVDALGSDTLAELARRASVDSVLVGSFARVDDELRITARLQDGQSGEILESATVSDRGSDRLFAMVDQLSRQLRASLVQGVGGPAADRPVEQVLTSSVEAFRLYSQGLQLHVEGKDREAIPFLEAAVEEDPGFSMALVRLATASSNQGQRDRARRYTQQALAGADRLPPRFRHYVEAQYYGSEWETYGKAIEAYKLAIAADPNRNSPRNLLAMLYLSLERYPEALEQYEILAERGDSFAFTYHALAVTHGVLDRWQRGYDVLEGFVERYPGNWLGPWALGWHLSLWGRLGEAGEALDRAQALHDDHYFLPMARWQLATLEEDFARAEAVAAELAQAEDSALRLRGLLSLATNRMFEGRARLALEQLEMATAAVEPGVDRAFAHTLAAELRLELGEPARALEETAAARLEGARRWPERRAIYLAARAEEALGRSARADGLLLELERRNAVFPNRLEERQIALLRGLLAGARGDREGRRVALREAAALLPPRGVAFHPYALPNHATVWLELGRERLEAGDLEAAIETLSKLASGESERADSPIPYGRGLFLLGKALAASGDREATRAHFAHFLELRRHGDLDREWVDEAARYLAGAG